MLLNLLRFYHVLFKGNIINQVNNQVEIKNTEETQLNQNINNIIQ